MVTRRNFLQLSANTKLENKGSDILIYVFQRGAADGLNLVVPYGDEDYYANRPNIAIAKPNSSEGAALDLDGFFGLNPALSALLPIYQNKDLAMVHACGLVDSDHSHFKTQATVDRGSLDQNINSGWLARYANSYENSDSTAFKSVALSKSIPKSLSGAEQVVALDNIASFAIKAPDSESVAIKNNLLTLFAGETSLDKVAQATFNGLEEVALINPEDFPVENDAVYPGSGFGNRFKDLALLIKSGIGVETASIDIGGWDTHNDENTALTPLAQDFAETLAAFYADMGDRMQNITVISLTEFGRRVAENGSGGTDHGTGNVAFVMGGGVNGGQVFTDWPGLRAQDLVGPGDLLPTTDYRTVIAELMDKRMNYANHQELFPDYEVPEYLGIFKN
jgi:uncharacterized protein (DUF1501 family)